MELSDLPVELQQAAQKEIDSIDFTSVENEISGILQRFLVEDEPYQKAYQILSFLPIFCRSQDEEDYLQELFDAFSISYAKGFFQFAYLQFHMLFMASIYFMLLKVRVFKEKEFDEALQYLLKDSSKKFRSTQNKRDGKFYFGSFALIGESDVFRLLFIMGMDTGLLGTLQSVVRERNKYAHANGNLTIKSQDTLNGKIDNYISLLERVFRLFKDSISELYKSEITKQDFYDPEIRSSIDETEQIEKFFIKEYEITLAELNICRKIRSVEFKQYEGYENIKPLHIALCQYYTKLKEN